MENPAVPIWDAIIEIKLFHYLEEDLCNNMGHMGDIEAAAASYTGPEGYFWCGNVLVVPAPAAIFLERVPLLLMVCYVK